MSSAMAGLGRRLEHKDPRNRKYALPLREARYMPRRWRYWWNQPVLDQGGTPWCVGFAGMHWLHSGPVTNLRPPFSPGWLYRWSQERDEWEGSSYDGTSALGLMKTLQWKGYVTEYRWAFDVETIFNWLLTSGPLLFGSNWFYSMFTPDDNEGFMKVDPASGSVGGHQYVLIGANRDKPCPDGTVGAVRILNSWGAGWGDQGRAWLSRADLRMLFEDGGDCCTAKELDMDEFPHARQAVELWVPRKRG